MKALWQEQHQQAFNIASAMPTPVVNGLRKEITGALKNGDGFGEFQKRLSKVFCPLTMPQR